MKQKAKAKNSHRDDVMNLLLVAVVEESRGFYLFLRRYFVSSFSRIMSVKRRENSHLTFKIFFQPSQSGRRLFCLHLLSDLPCGREFVFYFSASKTVKAIIKSLCRFTSLLCRISKNQSSRTFRIHFREEKQTTRV